MIGHGFFAARVGMAKEAEGKRSDGARNKLDIPTIMSTRDSGACYGRRSSPPAGLDRVRFIIEVGPPLGAFQEAPRLAIFSSTHRRRRKADETGRSGSLQTSIQSRKRICGKSPSDRLPARYA